MNRKRTLQGLLCGLVVCLGAVAAAQEEQWLSYRTAREGGRGVEEASYQNLSTVKEAPAGVKAPAFKGDTPLFAKWKTPMVKAGYLWLALDRSAKYGQYDVLYVDTDGDGDLAGEQAVKAVNVHEYGAEFPPVRVLFRGDDGPIAYHLSVQAQTYGGTPQVMLRSAGWYEGDVRAGGKTWRCQLVDRDANGAFNDPATNSWSGDRIRVGQGEKLATYTVGKYLEIGGALYRPEVARDGAFIKLTPAGEVPMGTVRVSSDLTELTAGGENGLFRIQPADRVGRLPAGTYQVWSWRIERKDKKGALWKAEASSPTGQFEVIEGKETPLTAGEPFVSTLDASGRSGEYRFSQSVQGAGEATVQLTRDGERPEAPKLRVRSADGSYDKLHSFEYG